jgi:hypothetical protein
MDRDKAFETWNRLDTLTAYMILPGVTADEVFTL